MIGLALGNFQGIFEKKPWAKHNHLTTKERKTEIFEATLVSVKYDKI